MAPKMSIIGELMAAAPHRAQVGLEQTAGGLAEAAGLPGFHAEAFTMRTPVMVSCRMFWISASLS